VLAVPIVLRGYRMEKIIHLDNRSIDLVRDARLHVLCYTQAYADSNQRLTLEKRKPR